MTPPRCNNRMSARHLALAFSPMFLIGFGIDLALVWHTLASGWRPAS